MPVICTLMQQYMKRKSSNYQYLRISCLKGFYGLAILENTFFFKGLVAVCHSFLIYFSLYNTVYTFIHHSFLNIRWGPSPYLHSFWLREYIYSHIICVFFNSNHFYWKTTLSTVHNGVDCLLQMVGGMQTDSWEGGLCGSRVLLTFSTFWFNHR